MTATAATSPFTTALEVPRWALGFYLRHLPWIVGLSLLPALERVALLLWDDLPDGLGTLLEVLVWALRALLVVLIYRAAISTDQRLRELDPRTRKARPESFLHTHRTAFALQLGLFACGYVVFSIPEWAAALVPTEHEHLYLAVVLAAKNPTVIAFYMIWVVGVVRQMLLTPTPDEHAAE
ncbi:hypothetical protein [Saccharopolyspora cebuensis]|uniref:Uncharacterized protein n=1 Tax=Saccharopolyspora cebuensis TaxID=418759 RepID=A0ABV4CET9_9PSEU